MTLMIKLFKERGSVSLCKLIFLFCVVLNLIMPQFMRRRFRAEKITAVSIYIDISQAETFPLVVESTDL